MHNSADDMRGIRRFRLRPTAFGVKAIAFYSVVVVSFYASPYTNLFFLLLSFLTILLVLNIWWTLQNVLGIRGMLKVTNAFAAQSVQECEIHLEIAQRPRLRMQIELQIGRDHHVVNHSVLVDPTTGALVGKLPRLPRGIHEVQAVRVTSTYPLGLIHASVRVSGPSRLVVYPAPLAERLVDAGGGSGQGEDDEQAAQAAGSGSGETASLRLYRAGDPMRHVHWRASARRQADLVVREFEPGSDSAVEVQLDRRAAETPENFEQALSAVARAAKTALELDQPLVFRTQELDAVFGIGHEPIDNLWAWLAIASPLPKDDPQAPPAVLAHDALRLPAALRRLSALGDRLQETAASASAEESR